MQWQDIRGIFGGERRSVGEHQETMTETTETAAPVAEEPEVSKETTGQPEPSGAPQDPEALETWALGLAAQKGWGPQQKSAPSEPEAPKVDMTPGFPDVPLHPMWSKWQEEGNDDAMQAYVGGVRAANAAVGGVKKDVEAMRAEYGRNQTLLEAASNLTADMKPYMAKAVQNIESMNNGRPIPGYDPLMVRIVENEARRLYMDAGAHIKKENPGETVPGGSREPSYPRSIIDAEKRELEKMGLRNVTDEFVVQHLKEQGAVAV